MTSADELAARAIAAQDALDAFAVTISKEARKQSRTGIISDLELARALEQAALLRERAGDIGQMTADALAIDMAEHLHQIAEATIALSTRTNALLGAESVVGVVSSISGTLECIVSFVASPTHESAARVLSVLSAIAVKPE